MGVSFLDVFYMSRISLRMLMGQYLAIHTPEREVICSWCNSWCQVCAQGFVGIIQEDLKLSDMMHRVYSTLVALCAP